MVYFDNWKTILSASATAFIMVQVGKYPTGGSEDGHSQRRQHKHGLLLDMLQRPS